MPMFDATACPTKVHHALSRYLNEAYRDPGTRQAHLLGTGPVRALEQKLCAWYGKRYALCMANATGALWAIARARKVKGSSFITSALGYGASIAGFLQAGAYPLFADIDPETLTLSPETTRRALRPDTHILLSVDLFGTPADDEALARVAQAHGLYYVADAAQSFGARISGRPASSLADAIVLSFTTGKALWAGEGAAVLTNDAKLYEQLIGLTQHPYRQKRDLRLGTYNTFGLNLRIHPLAAVWALADFEGALTRLSNRQRRAQSWLNRLHDAGLITSPVHHTRNIEPAYFAVTAAWQRGPRADAAQQRLGPNVRVAPLPASVLYRQPDFVPAKVRICPLAETHAGFALQPVGPAIRQPE